MSAKLNKSLLERETISANGLLKLPSSESFNYPEKVLQFGTGVLLRGLPDYFIHKGNQERTYGGRIVIVKSTSSQGADSFDLQNGLYTQIVQGIEAGLPVEKAYLNNSLSRVLAASEAWNEILQVAASPHLEVVISNTTEVGITYSQDDVKANPPKSFPGKLTAVLWHRFEKMGKEAAPGLIIIPTELIVNNGLKLKELVLRQAQENNLPTAFLNWVNTKISFCSSLVDRIVPGKPAEAEHKKWEQIIGYEDDLLIMSEAYRLWAIEGDSRVKEALGFWKSDNGVIIEPDITRYRERKLRLLNGVHTLSVGLGFLCGLNTVKEMMDHPKMSAFIEKLALTEMAPLVEGVSDDEAQAFGKEVLDRFRNPYIVHKLISITLQYTSKMAMRNMPLFETASQLKQEKPLMFLGLAAWLLFMKGEQHGDKVFGLRNGEAYPIQDDAAQKLCSYWAEFGNNLPDLVQAVLADSTLWGKDLNTLPEFHQKLLSQLEVLITKGANEALNQTL